MLSRDFINTVLFNIAEKMMLSENLKEIQKEEPKKYIKKSIEYHLLVAKTKTYTLEKN